MPTRNKAISSAIRSTLGQKFLMALSGLALVFYVILHLLGNLSLLRADPTLYNRYAKSLHDLGWLLTFFELLLLATGVLHIWVAAQLRWLANRSFGGVQVSRTFYARGQTGQQLLLGAYGALMRQVALGQIELYPRREMLDLAVALALAE